MVSNSGLNFTESTILKTFGITDIGTWWRDNSEKIFRYSIYKRMFTTIEVSEKYKDETYHEDNYHYGFISNIMEIPNDILLEIEEGYFEDKTFRLNGIKTFVKLSEIRLSLFEKDNEGIKVVECDSEEYENLYEN